MTQFWCGDAVEGWRLQEEVSVIEVASMCEGDRGSGEVFYSIVGTIGITLCFENTEMRGGDG